MMMWGYGPWYNGGNWITGLVMLAVQILFWGLIIWFAISLFKRGSGNSNRRIDTVSKGYDAIDILRERYARGEIDSEEFHRRKEDLMK